MKYLKKSSDKKIEEARKLMKYQNSRGGRISLQDIKKPVKTSWASALEAMRAALDVEKKILEGLENLHRTASKHQDFDVSVQLFLYAYCSLG